VESGPHHKLMGLEGLYAGMVRAQALSDTSAPA